MSQAKPSSQLSQEKWAWTEASSLRFQYHNTIPKKGTKIGNCLLEKNRTRGLSTPQRVLSTKVLLPPQPSSSALLLSNFWCLVFEGWDTNCLLPQDQVAKPYSLSKKVLSITIPSHSTVGWMLLSWAYSSLRLAPMVQSFQNHKLQVPGVWSSEWNYTGV